MAFRYYYRRYMNSEAERIILLAIVGFMVIIAFYAFRNYLMTGSFGLLAAVSAAKDRVSTSVKGLKTFLGSVIGMLMDGYAGFTSAVISAALAGNWAAIVFLTGYGALVFVMLRNYFSSGKFVR